MGVSGVKNVTFDFGDMSGGKNSRAPRHSLKSNQVADCLNAVFPDRGCQRAPGYAGLTAGYAFTTPIRGEFDYRHNDGSHTLVVISAMRIWTVDLVAGTKTEIGGRVVGGQFWLTSDDPCYAVNAAGKLWVVNGTDFFKIEDDLAVYPVGIAAPSGASATLGTGSLVNGVYGVYLAFARVDANGLYLYSLPQSLGNITVAAGNGGVDITLPDIEDGQITHAVAFMTDADGTVPYYYGEVAVYPNPGTLHISGSDRNEDIVMAVVSAANQPLPITPDGIYTFDDKLVVWDAGKQNVYWSLKTDVNPGDLERFEPANFRTLARPVSSVFSVGDDLFFNHAGNGLSVAYSGDMTSVVKHVQKDLWFLDCHVPEGRSNVVFYKGQVLGLTNDGFRFFDGQNFSDDLSFNLKPDMGGIYSSVGSMTPSAVVYTRPGKRTEFRFSWRNRDYSAVMNNYQLVFNLDFFFDPNRASRTWEVWDTGFTYQAVVAGQWVGVQNGQGGVQIVLESGVADINCFDYLGAYNTVWHLKQFYVLTRTIIDALDSITISGPPYSLAICSTAIDANIIIFDANNSKFAFSIANTIPAPAVLPPDNVGDTGGLPLPFVMNPQYPIGSTDPVAYNCRGNSVAIELSQVADDSDMFLYELQLPKAKQVTHNLT